jgi:putative ABC transport system substrate-binding protein
MRRRDFLYLVGGATAFWPEGARAQPSASKIARLGLLSPARSDSPAESLSTLNAFIPALSALGYAEGQNILIERKWAGGNIDSLKKLAAELVQARVDVIVAISTPAARAAKNATTTIPIVGIAMGDPVQDELVSSLARPGGNLVPNWSRNGCNYSRRLSRHCLKSRCCGMPLRMAEKQCPT